MPLPRPEMSVGTAMEAVPRGYVHRTTHCMLEVGPEVPISGGYQPSGVTEREESASLQCGQTGRSEAP